MGHVDRRYYRLECLHCHVVREGGPLMLAMFYNVHRHGVVRVTDLDLWAVKAAELVKEAEEYLQRATS